eukprot:COSAG01_NODE_2226_length_8132_cov_3.669862_7_plen_60_part_00
MHDDDDVDDDDDDDQWSLPNSGHSLLSKRTRRQANATAPELCYWCRNGSLARFGLQSLT